VLDAFLMYDRMIVGSVCVGWRAPCALLCERPHPLALRENGVSFYVRRPPSSPPGAPHHSTTLPPHPAHHAPCPLLLVHMFPSSTTGGVTVATGAFALGDLGLLDTATAVKPSVSPRQPMPPRAGTAGPGGRPARTASTTAGSMEGVEGAGGTGGTEGGGGGAAAGPAGVSPRAQRLPFGSAVKGPGRQPTPAQIKQRERQRLRTAPSPSPIRGGAWRAFLCPSWGVRGCSVGELS
jgi:hypothetical protein